MQTNPVIQATGLTKAYGGRTILRSIDLLIPRGQCLAFIGHNGSGKSTLLKALAGLVSITSGQLSYAQGATLGYIPEHFPKTALTAASYIRHMARIEGYTKKNADATARSLFKDFFMESLMDTPMAHLSKGSLQKVGVIQALLFRHDILLLDEPLSGQDMASQRVFLAKMEKCLQHGTTLLLSCHEPHLVNRLADVVYEIKDGTLHTVSKTDSRLQEMDCLILAEDAGRTLPPLPEGSTVQAADRQIIITVPAGQSQALLLSVLQQGYVLKEYQHAAL